MISAGVVLFMARASWAPEWRRTKGVVASSRAGGLCFLPTRQRTSDCSRNVGVDQILVNAILDVIWLLSSLLLDRFRASSSLTPRLVIQTRFLNQLFHIFLIVNIERRLVERSISSNIQSISCIIQQTKSAASNSQSSISPPIPYRRNYSEGHVCRNSNTPVVSSQLACPRD